MTGTRAELLPQGKREHKHKTEPQGPGPARNFCRKAKGHINTKRNQNDRTPHGTFAARQKRTQTQNGTPMTGTCGKLLPQGKSAHRHKTEPQGPGPARNFCRKAKGHTNTNGTPRTGTCGKLLPQGKSAHRHKRNPNDRGPRGTFAARQKGTQAQPPVILLFRPADSLDSRFYIPYIPCSPAVPR